jgi:uncharacterized damage-inducible protein DinB
MLSTLQQLIAYEAWADAQYLHVLFIYERVYADEGIRNKLEHIHTVQRIYLAILRGEKVDFASYSQPFPTPEALAASFREYHAAMREFAAGWTEEWLASPLPIDWFKNHTPTKGEAIMQVLLHGQSHRGQNASRMRDLAWKPPMTDFIVWVDKGQPEPDWPH